MVKLAVSAAGAVEGTVTAANVVAFASAVVAALAALAAGVVILAVNAWCPEPSSPLGGLQVHMLLENPTQTTVT